MSRSETPAGVARILRRRDRRGTRRIAATFRMGRDTSVWFLPRIGARLLSCYERAPLVSIAEVIDDHIGQLGSPLIWLARRIVFALAGRPRDIGEPDDDVPDISLPGSGWRGTILVIATWTVLSAGAIHLLG
ncbi:hypothetical protein ACFSGX_06625 [Sphingomonas arantia]|uniref:Uncharacterized protein n=1 Tax=Sphingomonas arantia TaxID=1460676 RepID=A0ABW4TXD0_9SPHN